MLLSVIARNDRIPTARAVAKTERYESSSQSRMKDEGVQE
jgi:hypothetical protein